MYIEASWPRQRGDNAKLELSVSGSGEVACLNFYYHMYGATMGTLKVYSGYSVVFNVSGNQGFSWRQATVTIYLRNNVSFFVSKTFQFVFVQLTFFFSFETKKNYKNTVTTREIKETN